MNANSGVMDSALFMCIITLLCLMDFKLLLKKWSKNICYRI